MDIGTAVTWWIAAGVLVAVELATGSFYLLMIALGAAAAAFAAHVGLSFASQLVVGALVGGGAVFVWHLRRQRQPQAAQAQANRDVNLDIGERVRVVEWQSDGTASVQYRGAQWSARYAGQGAPVPGEFVIREVEGSRLVLAS